ncbi:MAG: hypothetical protein QGG88_07600, partial [Gammaproteobacteria bacterium]|nr:hypothetical protein [Gammaproteobacteria bacterium]
MKVAATIFIKSIIKRKTTLIISLIVLFTILIAFVVVYLSSSGLIAVEPSAIEESPAKTNDDGMLLFAISVYAIMSSVALIVSVSISFYLYKWRKILLSKPNTMVPEEWAKVLIHVSQTVEKNQQQSIDAISKSQSLQLEVYKKSEQTLEAFMSLHNAMDVKDKEIERLKQGYDSYIYKKFLRRFIKADIAAKEMLEECPANDQLRMTQSLLSDALQECDVEEFEPDIGSDYRQIQGVADSPKIIETEELGKDFTIAEVINP